MKIDLLLSEKDFEKVFNNVAKTDDGLMLIGHLITRSMVSNAAFLGNSRDAYNKGRSEIGFELLEALQFYSFENLLKLFKTDKDERFKDIVKEKKKRKVENDD